jgi:shikimate dehydrogenase
MMIPIDAKTGVCALIGNPVKHSFSPLIHNAAFKEAGLNLVYVAFPVKEKNLGPAIQGLSALAIRGASITIPHKVAATRHVGWIDPVAARIGSINTIVNDSGNLKGYNSDGMGALKALQDRGVSPEGKRILIVGSGGAARGIAFTLAMRARLAGLVIVGVIRNEVAVLVDNLRTVTEAPVEGDAMEEGTLRSHLSACDMVINCTPVGMYPKVQESPVPKAFLREGLVVFDVVYNPLQTQLLRDAGSTGCHTISGVEMFINQAVVQFELWTGVKAPEAIMKKVILEQVSGR